MSQQYSLNIGLIARVYRPSTTRITVLPSGTPLAGADGTDGVDGKTLLNGTGAPGSGLGVDGDFYIDNTPPKTIYGPKAAGAWPAGESLKGDTGPAGSGGGHPFLLMGA